MACRIQNGIGEEAKSEEDIIGNNLDIIFNILLAPCRHKLKNTLAAFLYIGCYKKLLVVPPGLEPGTVTF